MERKNMSEFGLNDEKNEITENDATAKQTPDVSSKKDGGNRILREVTDYIEVFAIAIAVTVILLSMFFNLCFVDGASMEETLFDGETLVLSDLFYEPQRGDIVVFYNEYRHLPLVKRVIATENEKVKITYKADTMVVEVTDVDGNTQTLTEDYIKYDFQRYVGTEEYVVPEGHIFVLGDNRNNSADSRDISVGYVDERSIIGRMLFKMDLPILSLNGSK